MKIALSILSGISYGGPTYFRNIIPALAKIDKINEYHIFIQRNNPIKTLINQGNFIFHECIQDNRSAFKRHLWEQFILPKEIKKRKIDILFTAKNANILLAPCKTIISIRNMEPLCFRKFQNEWKLNFFSWQRGKLTEISIKKADRIIAVSKNTKEYLKKRFPNAERKIDVVYNGNPIVNTQKEVSLDITSENSRKKDRFLLSSSKFVAYANQFNLIQAYALLNNKNIVLPPLYFAGGVLDNTYFQKIKNFIFENNLKKKIIILGLISQKDLISLYLNADAFLFPSTLESCPHTLIEAMACGVPIAASNIEPIPEICEKAAIYFDPFKINDIANKIELLLRDKNLCDNLKKAALDRYKFFDWEKTAQGTIKVFKKTIEQS